MNINLDMNVDLIGEQLRAAAPRVVDAARDELLSVGEVAAKQVVASFPSIFQHPTVRIIKGVYFERQSDGAVVVGITPQAHRVLGPQIDGGSREQNRFEIAMQRAGYLPRGHFAVPASGAQLDRHENPLQGQQEDILRSLKRRTTGQNTYFLVPRTIGRQRPGVYQRRAASAVPVYFFVSRVVYRRRLPFDDLVGKVVIEYGPGELAAAAVAALKTGVEVAVKVVK